MEIMASQIFKFILLHVAFMSVSLLITNTKKYGSIFSFTTNLLGNFIFLSFLFNNKNLSLTELVELNSLDINILIVVGLLNLTFIVINGYSDTRKVIQSVLSSFLFLSSFFILGAKDFVTLVLSSEFVGFVSFLLIILSKTTTSIESAVRTFFNNIFVSGFFLLSIAFYFAATKGLALDGRTVYNHDLFATSVTLLIAVLFFKLGAFPFHNNLLEIVKDSKTSNLGNILIVNKIVVVYVFIVLIQELLSDVEPMYQSIIVSVVVLASVFGIFYSFLIGMGQKNIYSHLGYLATTHASFTLMTLCLEPESGFQTHIVYYLVFSSIALFGALLIIDRVSSQRKSESVDILDGLFYKNKGLSTCLILFLLSLLGVPFTVGFSTKFLLLVDYMRDNLVYPTILIILAGIIGIHIYYALINSMFSRTDDSIEISCEFRIKIIQYVFLFAVIIGGVAPALILRAN